MCLVENKLVSKILLEAEDFNDYGGWTLDSQFESQMGSPYLLAHGLGIPVEDAKTEVCIPEDGNYVLWVRTRDWAEPHSPGKFGISLNGKRIDHTFGCDGGEWHWERAGSYSLKKGGLTVALHDLTGFAGRCDALYFTTGDEEPPNGADEASRRWRKDLRELPEEPIDEGHFDVVVVGGGMAGCATALTSARLGLRVALIHDRPLLGGNASLEIGLMPRGVQGRILKELSARKDNGDLVAHEVLAAEPNVSLWLENRVFDVAVDQGKISKVVSVQAKGGHERAFSASIFVDTSGVAMLGVLAGADTLFGRESRDEYSESYAPEQGDDMHHGNTLFFRTRMADGPRDFPEVPWALEVAKDYANLSGQLIEPGEENGAGPSANPDISEFQFSDPSKSFMQKFPATHFWEYGQWLDPYTSGEEVRDHLMRALYGAFSNVKRSDEVAFANLEFEWMAFVAAQGEYKRYKGDYVLTENDIVDHVHFEDTLVANDGNFCIHCAFEPGETDYDFRLKDWIWDARDGASYEIPFRCLYSSNISNLMMAGKHISVTHVAGSATKLMGNGAQHGVAVAAAASLCIELDASPRELYESHLEQLKGLVAEHAGCDHDLSHSPPKRKFDPVPG